MCFWKKSPITSDLIVQSTFWYLSSVPFLKLELFYWEWIYYHLIIVVYFSIRKHSLTWPKALKLKSFWDSKTFPKETFSDELQISKETPLDKLQFCGVLLRAYFNMFIDSKCKNTRTTTQFNGKSLNKIRKILLSQYYSFIYNTTMLR